MAIHPKAAQLRRAQISDLPAVMELFRRVVPLMQAAGNQQWNFAYPGEAAFSRDIERGELWVAETDAGALAGVAAITTDQQPEYADAGLDIRETAIVVHRLAVDPEQRGEGIATLLMQHAEVIARERGISVVRLDTNTQNFAAQRFFVGLGYTLAGEVSFAGRTGLRFLCYGKASHAVDNQSMPLAAIALGSNLPSSFGPPEATLREAVARAGQLGEVRAVSSFYDTAPVGYADQPRFLNAALMLETELGPIELMGSLLAIERTLGRDRAASAPKGPRTIDLDLLLYGALALHAPASPDHPALTLPHPEMHNRRFVLAPLVEIAPEIIYPTTGRTIAQLLADLPRE